MWIADPAGAIGRVGPSGSMSRFPLRRGSGVPFAIAPGPAGGVLFNDFTGYFEHSRELVAFGGGAARRILVLPSAASDIDAVADGFRGAVWFTDFAADQIDELTPRGELRSFAEPGANGALNDIAAGPDGAMWFTDSNGLVGRVTSSGAISELALPAPASEPDGITAGPGRTIWVAESGADAVVRISVP